MMRVLRPLDHILASGGAATRLHVENQRCDPRSMHKLSDDERLAISRIKCAYCHHRCRSKGAARKLQTNLARTLPLVAALSVTAVASLSRAEEQQPQTTPTRDVDITYQITRG